MTIAHAHLAPWAPGFNPAMRANRAIDDRPGIQQEATCYQWFKQRLILSISEPSISQWSQIKEDTVEPSVLAWEFNLKAHAAITWDNDRVSLGLEPRLANHRSQAAHTATLTIAPSRLMVTPIEQFFSRCLSSCSYLMSCYKYNSKFTIRHAIPQQQGFCHRNCFV